jgi:hypothetical protein
VEAHTKWEKEGFEMPISRDFFIHEAFKRARYAVPSITKLTSWINSQEPKNIMSDNGFNMNFEP